jgi:hypothetical protein
MGHEQNGLLRGVGILFFPSAPAEFSSASTVNRNQTKHKNQPDL